MPRRINAQQSLPDANCATTRYAPKKTLFNPAHIPRAGPLILKEPPLQTARVLITRGIKAIQQNSERRISNIWKTPTGLDS